MQVILIYVALKLGIKRFKKDKLSSIDFKKYENYYREILKNYSPAELSYIDNFEILPENDIVATLLSLQLNKKVSLDESLSKIKIENDNIEEMRSNEKYVLDSIEDGKIKNLDESVFMNKVQKDATKNGLLKDSKIEWKKFIRVIILSIFLVALMIFICTILFDDFVNNSTNIEDWKLNVMVFAILLVLYIPISIGIYFGTYIIKSKKNSYIRTNKSEEINEKLEGLKNYLKDFSLMNERSEKSLILWEDYLIYSVIFNQNTKVVKSIRDKYIML